MIDLFSRQLPSRYFWVLILIVIDFVLKIGIYTFLDHPVPSNWDFVRIHPALNKAGIAGFADNEWIEQESNNIFGLAVGILLFSSVSFIFSRMKFSPVQFRTAVCLTGVASFFLAKPLAILIPHQSLTALEILHFCQISGAVGLAFAIYISRLALFTGSVVLLFSGSVGNQLGFLYPPYIPIDFVEIRNVGILNLADLYIFTGFFLLIAGFCWYALRLVYLMSVKLWLYICRLRRRQYKE